jgi:hypothetical protein
MTTADVPDATGPHLGPAPIELAALAARMREDWDAEEFAGGLEAARVASWPWPHTFEVATDMVKNPDATSGSLLKAVRRSQGHPDPEVNVRGAALARQTLAGKLGAGIPEDPGAAAAVRAAGASAGRDAPGTGGSP